MTLVFNFVSQIPATFTPSKCVGINADGKGLRKGMSGSLSWSALGRIENIKSYLITCSLLAKGISERIHDDALLAGVVAVDAISSEVKEVPQDTSTLVLSISTMDSTQGLLKLSVETRARCFKSHFFHSILRSLKVCLTCWWLSALILTVTSIFAEEPLVVIFFPERSRQFCTRVIWPLMLLCHGHVGKGSSSPIFFGTTKTIYRVCPGQLFHGGVIVLSSHTRASVLFLLALRVTSSHLFPEIPI